MSIRYQILGRPGKDNGLMVWVDTGNSIYRLLFDCGYNLLHEINSSEVMAIDYLFMSHYHLDHFTGFDFFLAKNYNRENKPVQIFGPKGSSGIIHHRLQGFNWNLTAGQPGEWRITEITDRMLSTTRILTTESFRVKHRGSRVRNSGVILENDYFTVTSIILDHMIPSAAYIVKEKNYVNIDKAKLSRTGLEPGPWLQRLKDKDTSGDQEIIVNGRKYRVEELRQELLVETKGSSIAYLTDFILDEGSGSRIPAFLDGCEVMICESQYAARDREFAEKNYHLTTKQAAGLAKRGNVKKLILFHISERYKVETDYQGVLNEAREEFKETYFPSEWEKYLPL